MASERAKRIKEAIDEVDQLVADGKKVIDHSVETVESVGKLIVAAKCTLGTLRALLEREEKDEEGK